MERRELLRITLVSIFQKRGLRSFDDDTVRLRDDSISCSVSYTLSCRIRDSAITEPSRGMPESVQGGMACVQLAK